MTAQVHTDQVFKHHPINPIPSHLLYPVYDASLIDFNSQAIEVPGTRKEGQTGHYRNRLYPDQSVLIQKPKPQTLYEVTKQVTDEIPFDNGLGYIPITSPRGQLPVTYADKLEWISYGEVEKARMEVGSAFMHLFRAGILGDQSRIERIDPHHSGPEGGWGVGIWSGNRPEWQITDMGCHAFSLVGVPLYDTLGPTATQYVSNHAGLSIIVVSLAHLPSMLKLLPDVPSVKAVICMESLYGSEGEMAKEWGRREGVFVDDFDGLRVLGRANLLDPMVPKPESIATISYTSGTTGNPKGVVLTHRNMTTAIIAQTYGTELPGRGIVLISYLPLSHVYGRFVDLMAILLRGAAAYSTGDTLRLLQDIQIIKPHILPSVPRVLNRIYAAIMAQANGGGIKGAILTKSLNAKLDRYHQTGDFTHPVYDKLFLSKLPQLLGGRILYMSSGSAPISKDVFETLKVAFAANFSEGWGMTETVGTGSKGNAHDKDASGKIGPPHVCNEFKLVDIPEMGYSAKDKPFPRGELCVKGMNVFSGYYKDEKNTRETIDEDGWMHTGDVCIVDEAGRFKIIDRKKNIMKLAQGEYVALESVEGVYSLHPVFTTMYVHGDPLKNHLVGVGVVDPQQAVQFIQSAAHSKLRRLKDPDHVAKAIQEDGEDAKHLKNEIIKSLEKLARSKGLKGYEMVKGIHLSNDPFPPDVMTPSFKFKRQQVADHFKTELQRAYAESEANITDAKGYKMKSLL
ncbi:Long-chain acyl-CoA synthetases (AMP-forming) [Phaffia rhodozyma]|uniref:Long-chain acyl-CoA synthetases (AMP-forming) n=1 Tax=Phaffia rhodozyma TaxID=264483 RepID=A0A0F7SMZ3_PHARH|nr:Long-chain acyl-CoA synthetases (AMP-forming) [Phaffia rhodozyma]